MRYAYISPLQEKKKEQRYIYAHYAAFAIESTVKTRLNCDLGDLNFSVLKNYMMLLILSCASIARTLKLAYRFNTSTTPLLVFRPYSPIRMDGSPKVCEYVHGMLKI